MILKHITIQNLGAITYFSHAFSEGLTILGDDRRDALSFAFRRIFNHRTPPPMGLSIGADTKIEGNVRIAEKNYRVILSPDNSKTNLKLSCYDESGKDAASEYLYLTGHSCEQDLADVFSGDEDEASYRFLRYANEDLYYSKGELSKVTDGLSDINAFRRYLRDFLGNSQPELLRDGKGYEIFLSESGRYAVRYKDGGSVTDTLSVSEKMLFKYLCFLRTAEFWRGFEEIRNLHGIKKPLLISGFLERLDEAIDAKEFLSRAETLKRQVILITNKDIAREFAE